MKKKKKKEYESDLGGYEHYLSRSIHVNFLIKPRFTDMISYIHSNKAVGKRWQIQPVHKEVI